MAAISASPPIAREERRTLRRTERAVVRAIAEAMFSEDGEVEEARLTAHVEEVDLIVSAASKPVRFAMRTLLFLVRISPILLFSALRVIDGMPVPARVAHLSRLERSRLTTLSLVFVGWRTVMTLVFYEHPSELRALGYTSHERSRYKRGLPVVASELASAAPVLVPAPVPVPLESGVRLVDADSQPELHSADDSGPHRAEVA